MSSKLLIKGLSIWSSAGFVHDQDLLVADGRLARIGRGLSDGKAVKVDGANWVALPGMVDLHAHIGEPGREDRESLDSALMAAASGGFTTILAMPDTSPPLDSETGVGYVLQKGEKIPGARAKVCCALTKERKGAELAELAQLAQVGASAAGDACPVADARLARRALEYAGMLNMPVMMEAQDVALARDGVAHEGEAASWLGLAGIPASSEWIALARDLLLAESTAGRLHVQGLSTDRSVSLVETAKRRGVRVTCECSFHHLILDDTRIKGFDTATKLMPPLRPRRDVEALIEGVKAGVIDCIVTDHTPLTLEEKNAEFDHALFGAAGFESCLPALYTHLVEPGILTWSDLVGALSVRPRSILGMPQPQLVEGEPCDITLFNMNCSETLDSRRWRSKAHNTPFEGDLMKGRVEGVLLEDAVYGHLSEVMSS